MVGTLDGCLVGLMASDEALVVGGIYERWLVGTEDDDSLSYGCRESFSVTDGVPVKLLAQSVRSNKSAKVLPSLAMKRFTEVLTRTILGQEAGNMI